MQGVFDDGYDEEWEVVINNGGRYALSRKQALIVQQAMASGSRGIVVFETFSISIPYVVEFFRSRRFKIGTYQLPAKATEAPFVPIPKEKWENIKKEIYSKIGKPINNENDKNQV